MVPANGNHEGSDSVIVQLRAFMKTYDLSLEELAGLLRITPQTLHHWFESGLTPPAWLLALTVLLTNRPKEISPSPAPKAAPAAQPRYGKPAPPLPGREEALRRARAI
ncbi:MAG TPA: helix-turn-helix transcriptional regulator [Hyphomicrobiales bacterium]|nr:helix-turn-helix transcriptional regulator [Hyphomicrobiales bacterium]